MRYSSNSSLILLVTTVLSCYKDLYRFCPKSGYISIALGPITYLTALS
nr:MAG TPA: hypothetical protein [Caudoviricetes sp.]